MGSHCGLEKTEEADTHVDQALDPALTNVWPMFGHYTTLMAELEHESQGDFIGFMRMEPVMFHELLMRLTPRHT